MSTWDGTERRKNPRPAVESDEQQAALRAVQKSREAVGRSYELEREMHSVVEVLREERQHNHFADMIREALSGSSSRGGAT